jgi:hypothetical protein
MDDIPQVSMEEGLLTAPCLDEEVKKAVFQMEHNKEPGPDGFPFEFYQSFGILLKQIFYAYLVFYTLGS